MVYLDYAPFNILREEQRLKPRPKTYRGKKKYVEDEHPNSRGS